MLIGSILIPISRFERRDRRPCRSLLLHRETYVDGNHKQIKNLLTIMNQPLRWPSSTPADTPMLLWSEAGRLHELCDGPGQQDMKRAIIGPKPQSRWKVLLLIETTRLTLIQKDMIDRFWTAETLQ